MHGRLDQTDRAGVDLGFAHRVEAIGIGRCRDPGDPADLEIGRLEAGLEDAVAACCASGGGDLADRAVVGIERAAVDAGAVNGRDARDRGDVGMGDHKHVEEAIEPSVASHRPDSATAAIDGAACVVRGAGDDLRVLDARAAHAAAVDRPDVRGDDVRLEDAGAVERAELAVGDARNPGNVAPRLGLEEPDAVARVRPRVDRGDVTSRHQAHVLESEAANAAEGRDRADVAIGHERRGLHAAIDNSDRADVAAADVAELEIAVGDVDGLERAGASVDGAEVTSGDNRCAEDAGVGPNPADVSPGLDRWRLHAALDRRDRADATASENRARETAEHLDGADIGAGVEMTFHAPLAGLDVSDRCARLDEEVAREGVGRDVAHAGGR